jgi:hypothetical protein
MIKKLIKIFLGIKVLLITFCIQGQIKTPSYQMDNFDKFKSKEKFVRDTESHYAGVKDTTMRRILSEKINLAVDDFKEIVKLGNATDKDFQDEAKSERLNILA